MFRSLFHRLAFALLIAVAIETMAPISAWAALAHLFPGARGSFEGADLASCTTAATPLDSKGRPIWADRASVEEMIQKGMPSLPQDRIEPVEEVGANFTYTVNLAHKYEYGYYLAQWADENSVTNRALWLVRSGDRLTFQLPRGLLNSRLWVSNPLTRNSFLPSEGRVASLAHGSSVGASSPTPGQAPPPSVPPPPSEILPVLPILNHPPENPSTPIISTPIPPSETIHSVPDHVSSLYLLGGSVFLISLLRSR